MEKTKKCIEERQLLNHLNELFGSVLDSEIIESVALNCNYEETTTTNMLLELAKNVDGFINPLNDQKKTTKNVDGFINPLDDQKKTTPPNTSSSKQTNSSTDPGFSQQASLSKKDKELERIISSIRQGFKILILMRGLPGSGKSTLAKLIVSSSINQLYVQNYQQYIKSTDDFFMKDGLYMHNPSQLPEAHGWNQNQTFEAMRAGVSPIIIDNTNLQMWEMKSYATMAVQNGYLIEIVEPGTAWAFNEKELTRRNVHKVSRKTINDMLSRYEKNVTPKKLIAMYNLRYNVPIPQMRLFPPVILHNYTCNPMPQPIPPLMGQMLPPPPLQFPNRNVMLNRKWGMVNFGNVNPYNQPIPNKQKPNDWEFVDLANENDGIQNGNVIKAKLKQEPFIHVNNIKVDESKMEKSAKENKNSNVIDLMDFENVESSTVDNKTNLKEDEVNNSSLVNEIFSVDNEDIIATLDPLVLSKGNANLEPESKKLRTDSEERKDFVKSLPKLYKEEPKTPMKLYPKLDLPSWGLTESTAYAWEPLENPSITNSDIESTNTVNETVTSSTNTCADDFIISSSKTTYDDEVKTLTCNNRDINENNASATNQQISVPPKKTLFDKSSMTDEQFNIVNSENEKELVGKHMEQLENLFPGISLDLLKDVYEKCNKNVDWAVDLLLDGNLEVLQTDHIDDKVIPKNDTEECNEISSTIVEISNGTKNMSLRQPSHSSHVVQIKEQSIITGCNSSDNGLTLNSSITIGSYEEVKVLSSPKSNCSNSNYQTIYAQPSTSSAVEVCRTNCGEITDVEKEYENLEIAQFNLYNEEMVELNLGNDLVKQLEEKFGNSDLYPKGFQPVIQVPSNIAKQLFAFYLESVYSQMEAQNQVLEQLVKEDEEFAKRLQQSEEIEITQEIIQTSNSNDIREIMAEERVKNQYLKETEEWKKLTPNDLAAKLTRKKLFESFPSIDQNLLVEILHAHGNCYKETVAVLMNSTSTDNINDPNGTIMEPPISSATLQEMNDAQKEKEEGIVQINEDSTKSANTYREEARQLLTKKHELYQKAQKHYQKGEGLVANYYSNLANEMGSLYEKANFLAAHMFLNNNCQEKDFHTLDLHYLFVKEALSALDIFVDRNIMLIDSDTNTNQELFIITGRGKGSKDGKSKLRPAVISRLKKRKLNFCIMNPGLLKVFINKQSLMSNDLN